jgi:hypothetical protein
LAVALLGVHTPSNNPPRFHRYKHTLLVFLVVAFYELRFYGVLKKFPEKGVINTAIE